MSSRHLFIKFFSIVAVVGWVAWLPQAAFGLGLKTIPEKSGFGFEHTGMGAPCAVQDASITDLELGDANTPATAHLTGTMVCPYCVLTRDENGLPHFDNCDDTKTANFAMDVTATLDTSACINDPNESGVGQQLQTCGVKCDPENKKHSDCAEVLPAVCDDPSGDIVFQLLVGHGTLSGTFTYSGPDATPPSWVKDNVLTLDDYTLLKNGKDDLKTASNYIYIDQSAFGGLGQGVMVQIEVATEPNTGCAGDLSGGSSKWRYLQDEWTGTPGNPVKVGGTIYYHMGGIDPVNDGSTVDGNYLSPGTADVTQTVNVRCLVPPDNDSGNVNAQIVNVPGLVTDNINFDPGTGNTNVGENAVFYFKADPNDRVPVMRVQDILDLDNNVIGKQTDVDGCRADLHGISQLFCRHQDQWDTSSGEDRATLTFAATKENGLSVTGDTLPIKLTGSCNPGSYELP